MIGSRTTGRRYVVATRISLQLHGVSIPEGMVVCHRCDNPQCVNPNHLFVGTIRDNALDAKAKGRLRGAHRTSHCPSGHQYEITHGRKYCPTCMRDANKRFYWRNRDAECARKRASYHSNKQVGG
jgi:hypothetical protein